MKAAVDSKTLFKFEFEAVHNVSRSIVDIQPLPGVLSCLGCCVDLNSPYYGTRGQPHPLPRELPLCFLFEEFFREELDNRVADDCCVLCPGNDDIEDLIMCGDGTKS